MRNIFDQYSKPENRLTHAIVCCLHEDDALKRDFVEWLIGRPVPEGRLHIVEQSLPGQPSEDEDGVKNSLPDAWIHSDNGWSVLIESKIKDPINVDQLKSHQSMARKRGYDAAMVCLISAKPTTTELPANVVHRLWPEVYEWLHIRQRQSEWARRIVDYMEVLEAKLIANEYLKEGSLTTFTGIHFDDEHPYSPREAKRLLKLAMHEIRSSDRLRTIGVDASLPGRGGIKESALEIWDFVRLQRSRDDQDFAAWPHFTLGLRPNEILAVLILPNKWLDKSANRGRLIDLGLDGFRGVITETTKRLLSSVGTSPSARPWILLQQRRWAHGRSAPPVADALVEFDPTTSLASPPPTGTNSVKSQPQWLDAVFQAIDRKNSNIEMCIGGRFLHECKAVRSREFPELVIDAWSACRPLLDAILPGDR